jgi:signal transduction histidine kinase
MADLQTGSYDAHFHKYDLYSDILRRLSMELIPLAENKHLEFILETPEVNTTVVVDEFSMRQIFSNLIDNAIKYTEKGSVKISFSRDEQNRLVVSIADTGIGIKEEYLPYLFDAFSQERQGYTRKFEGNGLGLALVKKYAVINNIDISIDTEIEKGTTFNLIFAHNDEEINT